MSTFFISDLHLGHNNCLRFDNRPFSNIEEHDRAIMERWSNTVGLDDDVWVLGDISWYNATKTVELFKQLNGTKHLCAGNHDKRLLKNRDVQNLFVEITNYKELQLTDEIGLVLCHYPIPCYNHHFYGWIHLYGHVHTSFEWEMMREIQRQMRTVHGRKSRAYNVGCMVPGMDFTPRTLDEILETFEKKEA